jgi:hypothetical protein
VFSENNENKKKQEIRTLQLGGSEHFLIYVDIGKAFSENTKTIVVIFSV